MPTERAEPMKILLLEDSKDDAISLTEGLGHTSLDYQLVRSAELDATLEIAGKVDIDKLGAFRS